MPFYLWHNFLFFSPKVLILPCHQSFPESTASILQSSTSEPGGGAGGWGQRSQPQSRCPLAVEKPPCGGKGKADWLTVIHLTSGQDGVSACCPDGCVSAVATWRKQPSITYPVLYGNHRNVNNNWEQIFWISFDPYPDHNHLKHGMCVVNIASVSCVWKDIRSFWLWCLPIFSLVALELG